jgi:pyruvate,water dikinase
MISMAINDYKKEGVKVGFCGQQPSDSEEFAQYLVKEGIDSISVTPDSIVKTIKSVYDIEVIVD